MNGSYSKPPLVFRSLLLVGLFAVFMSGCEQKPIVTTPESSFTLFPSTATNTETRSPSPTLTSTFPPTSTSTSTPEPTFTSTPVCLHILNPQDSIEYPELGEVKFEWEKVSGAAKYRLEMLTPQGNTDVFETFLTSMNRYLIMYPWGGTYTWKLTAIGSDGSKICVAGPFSFSKLAYAPTPKSTPGERKSRRPPPSENCG